MPISYGWDNEERTVFRCTYSGHWQMDEYLALVEGFSTQIAAAAHPVDVLADFSLSEALPRFDFLRLSALIEMKTPANQRLLVVVRPPAGMVAVLRLVRPLMPRLTASLYMVDTLDEAYALLGRGSVPPAIVGKASA